ncbi:MAG: LPXTG cell wall anchor domain-containing protein [Clostridia bacterium]|nr:LPXTG cell wall anchor domain-containing protein [Clostridia bacterium]
MKKLLATVITLALALTAFTATVSAAPSPEKEQGTVTVATAKDADNNDVSIKLESATGSTVAFDSMIADLQKENKDLKVTDHKIISAENNSAVKFPVTVEFKVPGVKDNTKAVMLLKKADGTVVKIEATVLNGVVKGVFAEFGEIVLLTDVAASEATGTSPKTGDTSTPIALAVLALSVGAAVVSVKKIKA